MPLLNYTQINVSIITEEDNNMGVRMLKSKKFLLTILLSIPSINSEELNLIFPETSDENLLQMNSYKAPYEEFGEIGFFVADKRLHYTISRDILENERFDQINQEFNILNMLRDLSKNHWIALNKRELNIAKNISKEMKAILLGKYGIRQKSVPFELSQNIMALKYRCIEQIEMSLNEDLSLMHFETSNALYKQNSEEFCAMYQLGRQLTNTPFFRAEISYDFMKTYGITENSLEVVPILEEGHRFTNNVFSEIVKIHPQQIHILNMAYSLKKQSYNSYLDYIYRNLSRIKYSQYRSIDRGRTSGTSRNTCMFNSVFFYDLEKHNIPSTKIGSLEKAQDYLLQLERICSIYGDKAAKESTIVNHIKRQIQVLKANRSADAIYSFCSEIQNSKIFPGYLFDVSVLELQCHSLASNFIIFPKTKTHDFGDCLFSHYGTGYYGSENFSIIPVSCSLGHAQSLTLI